MAVIRLDLEHGLSTVNPVTSHGQGAGVGVHRKRVDCVPDWDKTLVGHNQRVPRKTLMNQSLVLQAVENSNEAVVYGQHETSRQLLQLEPRVHQRRTVREEVQIRYHPIESPRGLLHLRLVGSVCPFGLCEVPCNSREQLPRRLDDAALVVLLEVPLLEDAQRILGQLWIRLTGHDLEGP